jgi:lysozyme
MFNDGPFNARLGLDSAFTASQRFTSSSTVEDVAGLHYAVNDATIQLIKSWEKFVPTVYDDVAGHPTIGYGHKCTKTGCAEVQAEFSIPLNENAASRLLAQDVAPSAALVKRMVKVELNENQLGALTSFVYNEGAGNFMKSALLKRLNNGEDPNTVAEQELPRWKYAADKKTGKSVVWKGLVNRRQAEIELFQTPSNVRAHVPRSTK